MIENYPKISIVTPSYNQGEFIEETIESVLDQKYPNLEYIIIDGGSSDNSIEIIKKYEDKLTYWISEKDNGQTDAINKGLRRATGDIFAYLNSDDTYLPGTFKKIVKYFDENPGHGILYGDYYVIDEKSRVVQKKQEIQFDYKMGCCIGFGLIIPQPSTFFKRDVINHIGYLDEKFKYAMDADYWFRASQVTKIKHIPEYISAFRVHSNSKTGMHINNGTSAYFNEVNDVLERAYNTLRISRILPFKCSYFFRKSYRIKRVISKAINYVNN